MLIKYLCLTKCWWKNQLWHADKVYTIDEAAKPPRHFTPLNGEKDDAKKRVIEKYKEELASLQAIADDKLKKNEAPDKTLAGKIEKLTAMIGELEGGK